MEFITMYYLRLFDKKGLMLVKSIQEKVGGFVRRTGVSHRPKKS